MIMHWSPQWLLKCFDLTEQTVTNAKTGRQAAAHKFEKRDIFHINDFIGFVIANNYLYAHLISF